MKLADVLMARYERASTILTSNRPLEDWPRRLGDVVVATPLVDRLMHHGHLLKVTATCSNSTTRAGV